MRTYTKEAFSLFESWASEAQSLFVVAVLKEGLGVGTKFKAVISKVSISEESVILRTEMPDGPVDIPIPLSDAVFEYEDSRAMVGPAAENLSCFLQARLLDGGTIMFLVRC
jgi:hypothetical protein